MPDGETALAAEVVDQSNTASDGEGAASLGASGSTASEDAQASAKAGKAVLESTIGNLLGTAFHGDEPKADEADDAAADEAEETEEGNQPADEEDVVVENEGAAVAAKVIKPDANAPTLPAAYTRTLKAYGWTDEEIVSNLNVLGPKFIETAGKLHANRNEEVSKWADAGRQQKQQQAAQQQGQQQQTTTMAALAPIDTAKLKEHYGDDHMIGEIEKINHVIKQVNAMLPAVQAVQQESQTSRTNTLIREIDGFFTGKELEPYKEIYGDAKTIAGDVKQQESRNKVLEMADALCVGANLQGRSLSLGEALTMAHDSLSSGYKTQAVRTTIKKELKTRSKGITQKPTGRSGGNNPAGANGTKVALERKVGGLMAKAFA